MSFTKHCALCFILLNQLILTGRWDKTVKALEKETDVEERAGSQESSRDIYTLMSTVLRPPSKIHWMSNVKSIPYKNLGKSLLPLRTTVPLCSPWDSCVSRCGERPRGLPFTCNCDYMCPIFADCCVDFEEHCGVDESIFDRVKVLPKCKDQYPIPWPTYVISDCPESYRNESIRQQCVRGHRVSEACRSAENEAITRCRGRAQEHCDQVSKYGGTIKGGTKFQSPMYGRSLTRDYEKCVKEYERSCVGSTRNCENTKNESTLVASINGLIYSNAACALCSNETKLKPIDFGVLVAGLPLSDKPKNKIKNTKLETKIPLRACYPAIDTCPSDDVYIGNENLADLCEKYSGPIVANVQNEDQESELLFKNIYCALCNGVEQGKVSCPSWVMTPNKGMSILSMYHSIAENVIPDYGEVHTMSAASGDLPAPFSILLNFGLDGRERMMFSSEGEQEMKLHQKLCGSGHIWDPFSKVCRKLFCSTDFILVDYRCVRKADYDDEQNETEMGETPENDHIHISLSFEVDFWDLFKFFGEEPQNLEDVIRDSLASTFGISIDRIRNVKINISLGAFRGLNETLQFIEDMDEFHPITFITELDLYETENVSHTERTVDSIVSMLSSSVSEKGFSLTIQHMNSRIYEFHRGDDPLSSWCRSEKNGTQIEYWNSDFALLLSEDDYDSETWVRAVYINKTQKTYQKGEFLANIFFQGYQFSGNLMNVSGVVFICEFREKLNNSCPRIRLEQHEYRILDNGTVEILSQTGRNTLYFEMYEESENKSILVCMPSSPRKSEVGIITTILQFNETEAYVSLLLLCGSIVCLFIVLVTYALFSQLRNLPGCNTMNLAMSLLGMQIIFILGQRGTVTGKRCIVASQLLHYAILCSFMWMNVMAYDLYKTFGNTTGLRCIRSKRKFLPRYIVYAYGTPAIIIAVTNIFEVLQPSWTVAPHYGYDDVCWITNKYGAIVFFAVPLGLVVLTNLAFYVQTILGIRRVKRLVSLSTEKHCQRGKNDVALYARMALVTGLTWGLLFVAAYIRWCAVIQEILRYLFVIFNTLQGVYIFIAFVCNRTVLALYAELIRRKVCGKEKSNEKYRDLLSKITTGMSRSISTDTTISTVSASSNNSNDVIQKMR